MSASLASSETESFTDLAFEAVPEYNPQVEGNSFITIECAGAEALIARPDSLAALRTASLACFKIHVDLDPYVEIRFKLGTKLIQIGPGKELYDDMIKKADSVVIVDTTRFHNDGKNVSVFLVHKDEEKDTTSAFMLLRPRSTAIVELKSYMTNALGLEGSNHSIYLKTLQGGSLYPNHTTTLAEIPPTCPQVIWISWSRYASERNEKAATLAKEVADKKWLEGTDSSKMWFYKRKVEM